MPQLPPQYFSSIDSLAGAGSSIDSLADGQAERIFGSPHRPTANGAASGGVVRPSGAGGIFRPEDIFRQPVPEGVSIGGGLPVGEVERLRTAERRVVELEARLARLEDGPADEG